MLVKYAMLSIELLLKGNDGGYETDIPIYLQEKQIDLKIEDLQDSNTQEIYRLSSTILKSYFSATIKNEPHNFTENFSENMQESS